MILDLGGERYEQEQAHGAQIIASLKQVEAGRTAEDVGRECRVSKHTIYAWKARFGGMEASEVQKVRALEDENWAVEAAGSRLEFGPRDAEGGDRKKGLSS